MGKVRSDPLGQFDPTVLRYRTRTFALRKDLDRLLRVSHAGAPEAVILYCARILEVLATEALRRLHQKPSSNLFSNLQLLEHFNRMQTGMCCWAHALRRLGNQVRHLLGFVEPFDAELAVDFAQRWLQWYFCEFSHGPRLACIACDPDPLALENGKRLGPLLASVEQLEGGPDEAARKDFWSHAAADDKFFLSPSLSAAAAEILLGQRLRDEALRLLEAGLDRFPKDLRLRQLLGLYWSRGDELDKALECLEPLYAAPRPDDETAGIIAGVYKRQWLSDRGNKAALKKSYSAYRRAWENSEKKNSWLGINAATTALYLGRRDDAAQQAKEIERLLHKRASTLPRDLRRSSIAFNYWDQVTLAEAQLLTGDWPQARKTYSDAFARYPKRKDDMKVSRAQRDEILKELSLPPAKD